MVFMSSTSNAEGELGLRQLGYEVCMPQEKYQHFYEGFPSTNGLSGKWITEVRIYTGGVPKNLPTEKGQNQPANHNRWDPIAVGAVAVILLGPGIYLVVRQKGFRTRAGKIDIRAIALLVAGMLCGITSLAVYFYVPKASNPNIAWDVTIIGSNGKENKVSYDAIREMPGYEGTGGFFTTAGVINGPYRMRGAMLEDLCELVGGLTPSNAVVVSATDGYSAIFDYDQVHGEFTTYAPKTMKEVPHGKLRLVLAYEQDGKALTQDYGKPLRLSILGDEPLLTEGLHWVKWVDKIEVITPKQ